MNGLEEQLRVTFADSSEHLAMPAGTARQAWKHGRRQRRQLTTATAGVALVAVGATAGMLGVSHGGGRTSANHKLFASTASSGGAVATAAPSSTPLQPGCTDTPYIPGDQDCQNPSAAQLAAHFGETPATPTLPAGWPSQPALAVLAYGASPWNNPVSSWLFQRAWSAGGPSEISDLSFPQFTLDISQVTSADPIGKTQSGVETYTLSDGTVAYGLGSDGPIGTGSADPSGGAASNLEWVAGSCDYSLSTVGLSAAQILAIANSLP